MNVLISGASGSFGSELVKNLEIFDTVSFRSEEINEKQKTKLLNCDVFIHCGALLNGNFKDFFNSNVLLTKNILDYLSLYNPNVHFIYFSSMSILKRKQNISPNEYANFQDMTDYALSKYISECIFSRYELPITVLRFSTLFFKDPKKDGLSKLTCDAVKNKKITIYNNGIAKRDFLPLDIAAQYVVKLIGKEKYFGRTLNIVSGEETDFRNIADFLKNKISNLIIENENREFIDNVPTNFSCNDIELIGKINFDIYEKIDRYIEELSVLDGGRDQN